MKTIESKAVAQDEGVFTAIAACFNTVDRVGDKILPGAFSASIAKHKASPKAGRLPLLWDHRASDPEFVLGAVTDMVEVDEGLRITGEIDLASGNAKAVEAWRAMKTGALSMSFGYLVLRSQPAAKGVTELLELDILECSVVPSPAHGSTHIVEMKHAATEGEDAPTAAELAPWPTVEEFNRKQAHKRAEAEAKRMARPVTLAKFDVSVQ